jgi:DNA-directed RNA polymerase specialized sigma24 family protein
MKTGISTNQVSFTDYTHELVEGCRKGDQKSQLQIYKRYYRLVYTICLKVSDNPAIAESLMYESFIDAFENIGTYSGDTDFGAWILKFIKYHS